MSPRVRRRPADDFGAARGGEDEAVGDLVDEPSRVKHPRGELRDVLVAAKAFLAGG
jgi:hypothetical protein